MQTANHAREAYVIRPLILFLSFLFLLQTPLISVTSENAMPTLFIFELLGLFVWRRYQPVPVTLKALSSVRKMSWLAVAVLIVGASAFYIQNITGKAGSYIEGGNLNVTLTEEPNLSNVFNNPY